MSVETQRQTFGIALRAVRSRWGARFSNRHPTEAELTAVTESFDARGLPGCMGSVDCMKIKWKSRPRAYKGQYHNTKDGKLAVLSCEALVDGDLYCWHWFAGQPETNNDITVALHSPPFVDITCGRRVIHLSGGYVLNGIQRFWPLYFLGDSTYPRWAIFFLPDAGATTEKKKHAKKCQEAIRKDVERFFGCLQERFRALRHDREEWSDEFILLVANVCIILHNMIVVAVAPSRGVTHLADPFPYERRPPHWSISGIPEAPRNRVEEAGFSPVVFPNPTTPEFL